MGLLRQTSRLIGKRRRGALSGQKIAEQILCSGWLVVCGHRFFGVRASRFSVS